MIASLQGTCIDVGLTSAVIECGGVGYEVHAAARTLAELRRGEECFVWVKHVIRADSTDLFAFKTKQEKDMFLLISSVSGIGPKLALAALNLYEPERLVSFIAHGEAKALQKIPGVGARTAGRIVVDLKDKVKAMVPSQTAAPGGVDTPRIMPPDIAVVEQVTDALNGLGFAPKDSERVVEEIVATDPTASVSEVLRRALKSMGGR